MKNSIIWIILAVIVVVGIGIFAASYLPRIAQDQEAAESSQQPAPSSVSTYESKEQGYSVSYPSSLQFKEYPSGTVVFGTVQGESVSGVAEVSVMTFAGTAGKTFSDVLAQRLQSLCAADGPTASFSCTGIERSDIVTADSGVEGFRFYLKGQMKDLRAGTTTALSKGPFFVFPVASSATASKVVAIYPPLNVTASEADVAAVERIAMSLRFIKASAGTGIEEYVGSHISQLSPVKEQLGGKFFVTAIEAHGGAGTVEYEDGHNAYTADFTYAVDAAGNPSVTSFKIRK
jgi:hypothetical protein